MNGAGRDTCSWKTYETVDGNLIVEDEFLNWFAVNIKSMSQIELDLIALKHL